MCEVVVRLYRYKEKLEQTVEDMCLQCGNPRIHAFQFTITCFQGP